MEGKVREKVEVERRDSRAVLVQDDLVGRLKGPGAQFSRLPRPTVGAVVGNKMAVVELLNLGRWPGG